MICLSCWREKWCVTRMRDCQGDSASNVWEHFVLLILSLLFACLFASELFLWVLQHRKKLSQAFYCRCFSEKTHSIPAREESQREINRVRTVIVLHNMGFLFPFSIHVSSSIFLHRTWENALLQGFVFILGYRCLNLNEVSTVTAYLFPRSAMVVKEA